MARAFARGYSLSIIGRGFGVSRTRAATLIERHFGLPLDAVRKALGLPHPSRASARVASAAAATRAPARSKGTRARCLAQLRSFHEQHGRAPRTIELRQGREDLPSLATVQYHFGGVQAAMLALGIESRRTAPPPLRADSRKPLHVDETHAHDDSSTGEPPCAPSSLS